MRNILFLACTLSSIMVWADAKPLAVVGAKNITIEEFNKKYDEVRRKSVNPPAREIFLEDLIRYEVGLQEAEKRNLEKDAVIAERMKQELYKGLLEKDLGEKISGITVSEAEMRDHYKSSPEIKTAHILIEVKPGATVQERAAGKKRAEEIYNEVKNSKRPFEELVNLYTDDISTKKNGGDVGFQTRITLYPSYYEAALKLSVGKISGLVETPYGFHIIKMLKINTYEAANKMQLRAVVFEKKKLAMFNEYFANLKKSYKISVNKDALK